MIRLFKPRFENIKQNILRASRDNVVGWRVLRYRSGEVVRTEKKMCSNGNESKKFAGC